MLLDGYQGKLGHIAVPHNPNLVPPDMATSGDADESNTGIEAIEWLDKTFKSLFLS